MDAFEGLSDLEKAIFIDGERVVHEVVRRATSIDYIFGRADTVRKYINEEYNPIGSYLEKIEERLKSAKTETAVSQRETIRQLIDLVDILRNRYTEKPTLDLIQVNGRSAW